MNKEDFRFEVEKDGILFKCDILEIIPNNSNKEEPYIIYTTYELDENGDFLEYFGKLIEENGDFSVFTELTKDEIKYIEETRKDEMVKYVNNTLGDVLNE